jgi:hypothetical protein
LLADHSTYFCLLAAAPLFCCDLVFAGPATTNWTAKLDSVGVACDEDGNPLNATDATSPAAAAPGAPAAGPAAAASPSPEAKSGAAAVQMASWGLGCAVAVALVGMTSFLY